MVNIPVEAVEAALDAYYASIDADKGGPQVDMRAALEAAAPHLMRAALLDVADDLDAGIVYGWDSDRQYADWLRARAAESEADRG